MGNYHLGIAYVTDRGRRLNFGAALTLSSYKFKLEQTLVTVPCCMAINSVTYSGQFISVSPLVDIGIDRKKILHAQVSIPLNIMMGGNNNYYHYFEGNGQKEGEMIKTKDSLEKFVPQMGLTISSHIGFTKRVLLVPSIGYTASLVRFTQFAGGGIKPAQLSLGLGISYKYGSALK